MCGRYWFSDDGRDEKLRAVCAAMEARYPGEYKTGEIFPGDAAPAIVLRGGRLAAVPAVFGFPDARGGRLLINARAETAARKPRFAEGLRDRRVILPAAGFFEWSRGAARTKYLFTVPETPTLYLCGLWEAAQGQTRFVILTREANESMRETHDRMPVIIGEKDVRAYLTDFGAAAALLAAAAPTLLRKQTI